MSSTCTHAHTTHTHRAGPLLRTNEVLSVRFSLQKGFMSLGHITTHGRNEPPIFPLWVLRLFGSSSASFASSLKYLPRLRITLPSHTSCHCSSIFVVCLSRKTTVPFRGNLEWSQMPKEHKCVTNASHLSSPVVQEKTAYSYTVTSLSALRLVGGSTPGICSLWRDLKLEKMQKPT